MTKGLKSKGILPLFLTSLPYRPVRCSVRRSVRRIIIRRTKQKKTAPKKNLQCGALYARYMRAYEASHL